MAETNYGTFEELLEIASEELRPIVTALKALVMEIDPNAVEVVRLGDRAATYGLGPKKMSEGYVYIQPNTSWINLGFYKGANLNDPTGLMEGTGKRLRHIKVRSLEITDNEGLKALVKQALEERREALKK